MTNKNLKYYQDPELNNIIQQMEKLVNNTTNKHIIDSQFNAAQSKLQTSKTDHPLEKILAERHLKKLKKENKNGKPVELYKIQHEKKEKYFNPYEITTMYQIGAFLKQPLYKVVKELVLQFYEMICRKFDSDRLEICRQYHKKLLIDVRHHSIEESFQFKQFLDIVADIQRDQRLLNYFIDQTNQLLVLKYAPTMEQIASKVLSESQQSQKISYDSLKQSILDQKSTEINDFFVQNGCEIQAEIKHVEQLMLIKQTQMQLNNQLFKYALQLRQNSNDVLKDFSNIILSGTKEQYFKIFKNNCIKYASVVFDQPSPVQKDKNSQRSKLSLSNNDLRLSQLEKEPLKLTRKTRTSKIIQQLKMILWSLKLH
ncbi:Hypothetical_protein [Hexamita inflata]|uniref:Hypothetical_protein n=1 Tax=Hexamita inflata TaxID=28002 RepID=A0AA86VUG2_9EUKA|nr:Hypothetical protein HINF_LOCUS66333 [Hexamita inflata]